MKNFLKKPNTMTSQPPEGMPAWMIKERENPTKGQLDNYGGIDGWRKATDFGYKLAQGMVDNLNKQKGK